MKIKLILIFIILSFPSVVLAGDFKVHVPAEFPFFAHTEMYDLFVPSGCNVTYVKLVYEGSLFSALVTCNDFSQLTSNSVILRSGNPYFHVFYDDNLSSGAVYVE